MLGRCLSPRLHQISALAPVPVLIPLRPPALWKLLGPGCQTFIPRSLLWYPDPGQHLHGVSIRVLNPLIGQTHCQELHRVLRCWALDQIPYGDLHRILSRSLDRSLDLRHARNLSRILDRRLNQFLNRNLNRRLSRIYDPILDQVLEKMDQALEQGTDRFLLSVPPLVLG